MVYLRRIWRPIPQNDQWRHIWCHKKVKISDCWHHRRFSWAKICYRMQLFSSIWPHLRFLIHLNDFFSSYYALHKVEIVHFWHHNRIPWVKISNRATFELNLIISCHLSIITMDFGLILQYLTWYSTLQWSLSPLESQNSIFPTSPSCSLSENM